MKSDPNFSHPSARSLGFWMCLALVMGNMIGSGVYLLPANLAPYGWNAVFGWGFTISGALCLATVLGRLSSALPWAGGPYGFVRSAFGPLPAFLMGLSYWVSVWVANAAIAIAAVSYLSLFFPIINSVSGLPALLAIGLLWAVTLINLRGARVAGEFQIGTMILKLLPLIAVILIVILMFGGKIAANPAPYKSSDISLSAITATAALTLWAMLGFESATVPQGKVANPEKTIARATMIGTVLVGFIYIISCTAIMLLLPAADVANSHAPFADFIRLYWGETPALFVALFAAISAIGALNGWVLMQGEVPLSMARAGAFPHWLAVTDARDTPVRGLLLSSVLVTILIAMNYTRSMSSLFEFMALLSTAAALVLYLSCACAALWLVYKGTIIQSWRFTIIAWLGVIYALWTFYGAGKEASSLILVLLAAGVPVYYLTRRHCSITSPA